MVRRIFNSPFDDLVDRFNTWFEQLLPVRLALDLMRWAGIPEPLAIHLVPVFWILAVVGGLWLIRWLIILSRLKLPRAGDATAHWASWRDLAKTVVLPSPTMLTLGLWPIGFLLVTGLLALADLSITEAPDVLLVMLLSTLGAAILLTSRLVLWSHAAMPYVLGRPLDRRWPWRVVGLFGGRLRLGTRTVWPRAEAQQQRQEHILICGPTGSGKTTRYFFPQLLRDAKGLCSAYVIETKTTTQEDSFLDRVGPAWSYYGKPVTLLDPWSGTETAGWNPLAELTPDPTHPETVYGIDQIVDAIVKTSIEESGAVKANESYYLNEEVRLLKVLCMVSLFKPPAQRTLPAIRQAAAGNWEDLRLWLMTDLPHDPKLESYRTLNLQWILKSGLNKDRLQGLLSGVMSKLKICEDPGAARVLATDGLRINNWLETPGLLILRAPIDRPSARTFASLFSRLLALRLYRRPKTYLGQPFMLWLYLDELPSLGLPQFPTLVATARSAGVGIIGATQDLEDLRTMSPVRAGANSSDSLLANFRTIIALPGCSPYTCQWFSRALGLTESEHRRLGREGSHLLQMRYYREFKTVPLLTADSLRHLPPDQALIYRSRTRSFLVESRPYYQDWPSRWLTFRARHTPIRFASLAPVHVTSTQSTAPTGLPWGAVPATTPPSEPVPLELDDQSLHSGVWDLPQTTEADSPPSTPTPTPEARPWGLEGEW